MRLEELSGKVEELKMEMKETNRAYWGLEATLIREQSWAHDQIVRLEDSIAKHEQDVQERLRREDEDGMLDARGSASSALDVPDRDTPMIKVWCL